MKHSLKLFLLTILATAAMVAQAHPPEPTPEVQRLIDVAVAQSVGLNDAIPKLEAARKRARALKDRCGEGRALYWIGSLCQSMRQRERALQYYNRALPIMREVKDREFEAGTLNHIGTIYHSMGQPEKALQYYNLSLPISREVNDREGEASTLNNIGGLYDDTGNRERALEYYNLSLPIQREVKNRKGEAVTLSNIGMVYHSMGQPEKALQYYNLSLPISREVNDREGEASTLNNIGGVYDLTGHWERALEYFNLSLSIQRELKDWKGEGQTLNNIGNIYAEVGQPERALEYYNLSLSIQREVKDRRGESVTLHNIGSIYDRMGQREKALEYYDLALSVSRKVKDRQGEGETLNSIGTVYAAIGQRKTALAYYNLSLSIRREVKDRRGESVTLSNVAGIYDRMGQPEKALQFYILSISISREVKNRTGEAFILGKVGRMLAKTEPGAAIWYEKRAVNLYEALRQGIAGLARESRESYKKLVADVYRDLADLLIAQGRIPEAEQVLRLLKDDEVYEFVRRTEKSLGGSIAYTPDEAKLDQEYEEQTKDLAELGARMQALRSIQQPTAEQIALIKDLDAKLTIAEAKFQDFLKRLVAKAKTWNVETIRLNEIGKAESIQSSLARLPKGTVAVYTLAAPDALRLIFVTPTTTRAHTVGIKAPDLNKLINEFRSALRNPAADPKVPGQRLYELLVKPIEEDLEGSGAKTIMWSLDSSLRYIPMAALWDGNRYMVERFESSIFNPSSSGGLEREARADWRALAAGVSTGRKVKADDGIEHTFDPLSGVPKELDSVVAAFPGSKALLDASFTVEGFRDGLLSHPSLVHLTTHFAFNAGDETKSFLLTGGGPVLSVAQARTMPATWLQGVSLLTMSACETGLGGTLGDGSEVESIAVIFQMKGAEALLSTLWSVADEPTRLLMARFYQARKSHPEWTKLECLRRAQLSLLHGEEKGSGGTRSVSANGQSQVFKYDPNAPLSHPYYWAPFVLSGNWK